MKRMLMVLLAAVLVLSVAAAEADNRYEALDGVSEPGFVAVQKNGLWGIVDHTGTLVIPCEWERIDDVYEGKVRVCRNGLWGCIDLQGNVLLQVEWDNVTDYIQSCYAVERNGLYGLADSQGNLVLPLEKGVVGEEWIGDASYIIRGTDVSTRRYFVIENGEAKEVQVEKRVAINAVPEGYETAYMMSSVGGWVKRISQPAHYRFADLQGSFLTEDVWDEASGFSCGLSMVKKDGKVGFVNEAGEIAIPPVYDGAWDFTDEVALVRQGDERFWIDTHGNRLSDWNWARGSRMRNGYATVITEEGLYGIIDKQGDQVIPCEWDGMEQWQWPFMWGEIVSMERDGQRAFLNKQGELITGRLHERSAIDAEWYGDHLFLLEDGVLSIWHADGTKSY